MHLRTGLKKRTGTAAAVRLEERLTDSGASSPLAWFPHAWKAPAVSDFVQVTTTTDDRGKALALARAVVEARAAACAQVVGPIESVYWWQGAVETATEWQVVAKTTAELFAMAERVIRRHHDYETPEIVATPIIAGGTDYLGWIRAETTPGASA